MSNSKEFESPNVKITKAEIFANNDKSRSVNLQAADVLQYREHMYLLFFQIQEIILKANQYQRHYHYKLQRILF